MKPIWGTLVWLRILLPLVGIALLGLSARPWAASLALQAARLSWEESRPLEASSHLSRAAGFFPWRGDLWELAGRYAVSGGDPQAAILYLGQAAARGPLSPEGNIALGDAQQALGDPAAALQSWQSAIPHPEAYRRLAQRYRALGDFPAAIASLQALLVARPNDAPSYYETGLLLAATKPESAIAYLTRAAELDASRSAAAAEIERRVNTARLIGEPAYTYMSTGRVLASLGEWDLASEAFRQAAVLRSDYAEAWAYWGEARQHTGDGLDDAGLILSDLQRAWRLSPDSLAANLFLAFYWRRQQEYDRSLAYLYFTAGLDPANPAVQVEIGNTLAEQGNLPAAEACFLKAIEIAPQDVVYWRMLAQFSLQHQIQVRQLALYASRQAVILAPDDPISLDLMGQTLLMLEDYLNAERFILRALAIHPNYAPARLHLGQVYLFFGDSLHARDQLTMAQALAPGTPTADLARRLLRRYFP